jgi:hypothetical protein
MMSFQNTIKTHPKRHVIAPLSSGEQKNTFHEEGAGTQYGQTAAATALPRETPPYSS